jgi:hypothetical protein
MNILGAEIFLGAGAFILLTYEQLKIELFGDGVLGVSSLRMPQFGI